jgi:FkbM family methyltransferase
MKQTLLLGILVITICCWIAYSTFKTDINPGTEIILENCIAQSPKRVVTYSYRCPKATPDGSLFKSQSSEDQHLMLFFNGLCNGTYVELGALDGVLFSNTYVFNKALGWKGVLLELSPSNFESLRTNRREEIAVINAAVCAQSGTVHCVEAGAVGGVWEFAAADFRNHFWGASTTIENSKPINCVPLRDVFHSISEHFYADFLSLDVEGAELDVLESIDFDKTAFGIILIEADTGNITKNVAVREFLVARGYAFLYWYQRSDWFINDRFREIYQDNHGPRNLGW